MSKNNFTDRLLCLIKENSCYEFPESKTNLVPDFGNSVKIQADWFQLRKIRKRTIGNLYKAYDLKGLEVVYSLLGDEYSKEMFLRVILYRIFDKNRFRLPLYYSHIWKFFDIIDTLLVPGSSFKVNDWDLHLYDLEKIGFKVKIHHIKIGIFINYILEQYRYKDKIYAKQGDYVIDGGACYGDTALYFADVVKDKGRVFSFEFVEENLKMFKKNIEANPDKKDIIKLTERPLYSDSLSEFSAAGTGPGCALSRDKTDKLYKTIAIDDFVQQNQIKRVDFIKLDIEGSEMDALKGAIRTIKEFRPQMAICLYHKNKDFSEIPNFLKELVPEYELYLDHFTIIDWETVLFAKVPA
jgi:FkbM family methyltransferase